MNIASFDRDRVAPKVLERVDNLIQWAHDTFPDVTVETPWGFPLIKVKRKIMFIIAAEGPCFRFTAKLKESHADAMDRPNVEPASHGLGDKGWISATISPQWNIDDEQLKTWVVEAFHIVAQKRVLAAWKAAQALG